jgi:hypothetical protein
LIGLVLAGAAAGSWLTWAHPEESVATQVTILVAAVGAIIALIKWMPPRQTWPMADAVGELRDGAAVAGRVVRIGWWHLICPSDPVCTVLGVNDSDTRESATGHHLSVCFPA